MFIKREQGSTRNRFWRERIRLRPIVSDRLENQRYLSPRIKVDFYPKRFRISNRTADIEPFLYCVTDGASSALKNYLGALALSRSTPLIRDMLTPSFECIGVIEFPCCQLSCRLPKREAKSRHGESFVSALLKTSEEDLKQQPVYQDSPKDAISDFSLEIELAILFAPNPQDIPQQLQLGEVVHYLPSERSHCSLQRHTGGHMDQGSHSISHMSEFLPGTHASQCDHRVKSLPKPLFHHLGNCAFQQCWIDDFWCFVPSR
ncbi:uncharacterized protein TNCV_169751 [Trichonephila clavipes]|nr:uncharacterized protein TNCV_169751 [Trichonephila clavipes]